MMMAEESQNRVWYYYATGSVKPDSTMYYFQAGNSENVQASENLTNQLDGVTVVGIHYRPSDWNKQQIRYE